jgi:hypothetical protein
MPSTINATTSGVVTTGDSVATLSLQTGGTTAVAIDSAQIVSLSKSLALLGSMSGSVALAAPATAGTQSYTLPTAQPTANGQALTATTAGVMSWATAGGGTPGGSNLQFQYNNSSAFGGASNFTYNATGPIVATTIGVGAATPSASGSGITFPSSESLSTNANTLDDYEEGTWTPTLGGTATYSIASGKYTKVGNSVFIQGIMTVTSIGTGSTSTISGLPYAGQSAQRICLGGVAYWGNFAASTITVIPWIDNGATTVQFAGNASAAASLGFLSPFQNGTFVQFSGCYITNI